MLGGHNRCWLRSFQRLVVPGLLQIGAFAVALFARPPASRETEAAADACQQILDDETRHFDWVITEGALWWRPADWQVQAEQIRAVVAQTRPNVDVRILPLDFQAPNFSSLLHDPRQRLVTADSLAEVRLSDQVDVVYQTKSTSSRGCSRLRWARRRAWRC